MDPILHLVRNAVSHGLETVGGAPRRRQDRRRPAHAQRRDRRRDVVLEISDDGRGIDAAAVARRAPRAGPAGPGRSARRNEALLDILCAPGFSTRDAADRASGRGVGMAVVRHTVQELGGTLTLDTVAGNGTRFAIELPLTLAITDAIIASVGDQTFAVPQAAVREVIEVDPGAAPALENNEIVAAPGRRAAARPARDAVRARVAPRPRLHVLVVGTGARRRRRGGRSHRRPARDRRARDHRPADPRAGRVRAPPTSATAASC